MCVKRTHAKAVILEDSTYAVPVANRRVRGNSLHIEEAFIDALYLTRRKLSTLLQTTQSQKQSKQLRLRV